MCVLRDAIEFTQLQATVPLSRRVLFHMLSVLSLQHERIHCLLTLTINNLEVIGTLVVRQAEDLQ